MKRFVTRNILLLSLISFFNDLSSEIIYPILPLYLSSIGLSYTAIGAVEGVAELISSLSKVFFGFFSDKLGKKVIFVKLGYAISAFSKPIIGLSQSFPVIFISRVADRFSKGIRTAPRDAILISESKPEDRAKVFSFHRSIDNLGGAIAPIGSLVFLVFLGNNYSHLFLAALIPGAIAVTLTFLLKVKSIDSNPTEAQVKKISFNTFIKKADINYKKILFGLVLLSILNSTDFYFLLRAKEILAFNNNYSLTVSPDILVLILYIIFNISYVTTANPIGAISDKLGHKKSMIAGMLFFAVVYGLFAYNLTLPMIIITFICWGIFMTIYDNVSKAWLSLYIPKEYKATGIGLLVTLMGIGTFFGNMIMGSLIDSFNSSVAFSLVSIASIFVLAYFLFGKFKDIRN